MNHGSVFTSCDLATLVPGGDAYGMVRDAALVAEAGRIVWLGGLTDLPRAYAGLERHDLGGRLVTPALIDCHTHLVHGGNRAAEFELRLNGASYEQIARAGGGIMSTVTATRAAGEDALLASALPRVDAAIAEGVAVLEVKSGYGLDMMTELRMLRVGSTDRTDAAGGGADPLFWARMRCRLSMRGAVMCI